MTKYLLIMYMCSMVSGQCPSSHVTGYSFESHAACVEQGYKVAHNTFRSLEDTEEMEREYIETARIVIRFDCQAVEVPKPIIPPKKPKVNAGLIS